jgi:hypothetical protein
MDLESCKVLRDPKARCRATLPNELTGNKELRTHPDQYYFGAIPYVPFTRAVGYGSCELGRLIFGTVDVFVFGFELPMLFVLLGHSS